MPNPSPLPSPILNKNHCLLCRGDCCKTNPLPLLKFEYMMLKPALRPTAKVKEFKNIVFLEPPCPFYNDAIRCTIYKSRPLACKVYPYVIMRAGESAILGVEKLCPEYKNAIWEEIFQAAPMLLKILMEEEKDITEKHLIADYLKQFPTRQIAVVKKWTKNEFTQWLETAVRASQQALQDFNAQRGRKVDQP